MVNGGHGASAFARRRASADKSRLCPSYELLTLPISVLWFRKEDAVFFGLALAFEMAYATFALDRFFRWRLRLDAWRRVRLGA
jgi:hypothetical protein